MGKIWVFLLLSATTISLLTGNAGAVSTALLASGEQAVTLVITLLGTMPLWSGLMEILSASGDVDKVGRLFRKLLQPLFPGLTDEQAWQAILMNLSANLLGLGNAATPAGMEAARRLSSLGDTGLRSLSMLLVLDNASLQLIPTTVITLRQSAGASDPADIWGMTLMISGVSMVMAVIIMKIVTPGRKPL